MTFSGTTSLENQYFVDGVNTTGMQWRACNCLYAGWQNLLTGPESIAVNPLATAVAPYSTRSLPQASVSTPIGWDEVSEGLKADHYTVDNIGHRLRFLKRDPWEGFLKIKQRLQERVAHRR